MYLNQEQKTLEFFQSQAIPNKEGSIELTNEQNIVYYDQAVIECKALAKCKMKIYQYYDQKYTEDKALVFRSVYLASEIEVKFDYPAEKNL